MEQLGEGSGVHQSGLVLPGGFDKADIREPVFKRHSALLPIVGRHPVGIVVAAEQHSGLTDLVVCSATDNNNQDKPRAG